MKQLMTLINGDRVDCVDVSDRGLQYGDGLFETMAVRNGKVSSWSRHMARLQAGCKRLGMAAQDSVQLAHESKELLTGVERGVLKIILTRGSGGRGYRVPEKAVSRRILQLHSWPEFPPTAQEAGVTVRLCSTRLCHNPLLAGIKHLNRLEQVLARREWNDPQIAEGLLQDVAGNLVEGTMSNLFLVKEQLLLTPELHRCGVAGIMRSIILEQAGRQLPTAKVCSLDTADLLTADEVFICNSLFGIWPVISIDGTPYRKGEVTAHLQEVLQAKEDTGSVWRP